LEFEEDKRTFAKIEGGNVDFFSYIETQNEAKALHIYSDNTRNIKCHGWLVRQTQKLMRLVMIFLTVHVSLISSTSVSVVARSFNSFKVLCLLCKIHC
jgi:hypothetical protein